MRDDEREAVGRELRKAIVMIDVVIIMLLLVVGLLIEMAIMR